MGLFNDVVALAKAGWTPADVKELMEKDSQKEEKEETKVFEKKTEEKKDSKAEEVTEEVTEEDEKDYKALYERAMNDLNDIQVKNSKEDMKPLETNMEDIIKDIKSHIR